MLHRAARGLRAGRRSRTLSRPFCRESASGDQGHHPDPRERVLQASLQHVPQLGWSEAALAKGAQDCGLPGVATGMFNRGAIELVDHFMENALEDLRQQCKVDQDEGEVGENMSQPTGEERLQAAMLARLQSLQPYRSQWPQAMALGMVPGNVKSTAKSLAHLADELAVTSGDTSTELDWYGKRVAIAGFYVAAELYMLSDSTDDLKDTRDFLARGMVSYKSASLSPSTMADIGVGVSTAITALGSAVSSLAGPALKDAPGLAALAGAIPSLVASVQNVLRGMVPKPGNQGGSRSSEEPESSFSGASEADPYLGQGGAMDLQSELETEAQAYAPPGDRRAQV
ncbi:unnamed protein product [Chrysoparadoxa australica]